MQFGHLLATESRDAWWALRMQESRVRREIWAGDRNLSIIGVEKVVKAKDSGLK